MPTGVTKSPVLNGDIPAHAARPAASHSPGGRCFHPAPFGYRYIPVSESNGGGWEIDSQEAAVVQQIFAWYTESGWSLKKIATQLNEKGVPVRRKGGGWGAGRISVILDQPAYAGKAYYNRYRTRPETVGRRKKQG